jgi:hypothetical protein
MGKVSPVIPAVIYASQLIDYKGIVLLDAVGPAQGLDGLSRSFCLI